MGQNQCLLTGQKISCRPKDFLQTHNKYLCSSKIQSWHITYLHINEHAGLSFYYRHFLEMIIKERCSLDRVRMVHWLGSQSTDPRVWVSVPDMTKLSPRVKGVDSSLQSRGIGTTRCGIIIRKKRNLFYQDSFSVS